MDSYNKAYVIWNSIIQQTISAGRPLRFDKVMDNGEVIPDPDKTSPEILTRSLGELKGQTADRRASFIDSKSGFHAVEFEDHFETHIDKVDPNKDPFWHLVQDSPGTLIGAIAAVAIGAILVYVFTRKK